MQTVLVLVHSPLIGPLTWSLVANDLRQGQVETIVPRLDDDSDNRVPYWEQHVEAVKRAIDGIPQGTALALVGHSGAGALLPSVGRVADHPIAAYIFVDAGIPMNGLSRLDLMAGEDHDFAESLRQHLVAGDSFPDWSEDDLATVVPDPALRRELVAELRPRGLDFFSEPIPVFSAWPDAPCAYLQFSASYDVPARKAREVGWRYMEIPAGHFHMLVNPAEVANALLELV